RLYHYVQNPDYLDRAARIIKSGARPAAENPFGFGQLLMAIYLYVKKPVEVTVIGRGEMAKWLNGAFLPDGITASVSDTDVSALQKYAFFKGRAAEKGETAFVCRNFTCSLPIKSQQELARQLGVTGPF
ncbi:MAG: thioredoxin, partial [Nitrososphaera sp.]